MKDRHQSHDGHERLQPCVLSVDWNGNDRSFRCGDAVRGSLRLESHQSCRCRRLKIAYGWFGGWDEIPGKERCHDRTEVILVEDETLTTGTNSFAFSFEAPAQPPSYAGRRLTIRWRIEGTAEIDDGAVVRVGEEFRLTNPVVRSDRRPSSPVEPRRPWTGRGIEAVGYLFFALALLGMAALCAALMFNQGIGWRGLVFLLIPALIYGAHRCSLRGFQLAWLTRRLGTIRIDVPKRASRKEMVSVAISIAPRSEVRLNRLAASLVCQESCVRGSEYEHIESCTVSETAADLIPEATTLVAQQEYRFPSQFTVPPDAPLPFTFDRFSVGWGVVFRLETSDGQDWVGGSSVHLDNSRTGPGASHEIH